MSRPTASPRWALTASVLAALVACLMPGGARAQWAVFDAAVYAQNVIEAARLLQQINNQIQALQNQALMLENMARNLASLNVSQLGAMVADLNRIGSLMNQAQGIAFNVSATQAAFNQYYPQQHAPSVDTVQLVADARQRWQQAMDAFGETLTVQAQVTQNVQADTGTLGTLVDASQAATGNLQVAQAANQLRALAIKQQLQSESLIAAQDRAVALESARNAEAEEEAQAEFTRFIGSSNAYTPQ
ncbi:MAG TPA: P-type conjugative transfer protein TrbJ [Stellaceae bacterium]|nr:P-type conjugative transfer protein TrbJ [Stellaceae bacterium]